MYACCSRIDVFVFSGNSTAAGCAKADGGLQPDPTQAYSLLTKVNTAPRGLKTIEKGTWYKSRSVTFDELNVNIST